MAINFLTPAIASPPVLEPAMMIPRCQVAIEGNRRSPRRFFRFSQAARGRPQPDRQDTEKPRDHCGWQGSGLVNACEGRAGAKIKTATRTQHDNVRSQLGMASSLTQQDRRSPLARGDMPQRRGTSPSEGGHTSASGRTTNAANPDAVESLKPHCRFTKRMDA